MTYHGIEYETRLELIKIICEYRDSELKEIQLENEKGD